MSPLSSSRSSWKTISKQMPLLPASPNTIANMSSPLKSLTSLTHSIGTLLSFLLLFFSFSSLELDHSYYKPVVIITVFLKIILPAPHFTPAPPFLFLNHSPFLTDTDFHANPMVLLIGQYSTGKTSFIQYIIERDFQGMRIGPEPTTDKFTAVIYGDEDREIPGNALAAMSTQPFTALQKFGIGFLNRFEASMCNSPILEKLTFIDTPGVLSGEKQRVDRSYNFPEVVEWFAGRADRILLLFDANKLDISDEFKTTIEALKGNDDKIRCVLNKADSVSPQQLMRVYGALMWSLGRVVRTPEVLRVYTGSFWSQPLQKGCQEELLLKEEADLLADLRSLPRNAAIRKVNEFVKRARQIKVHALICEHLRSQVSDVSFHRSVSTHYHVFLNYYNPSFPFQLLRVVSVRVASLC